MRNCEGQTCQFSGHPRCLAAMMLAACLAGIVGCGVGDYRARVETRVRNLGTTGDTADLGPPQLVGNGPVSVRIPKAFETQPLVDNSRVQPGLIDLPGLAFTYEEFVRDAAEGRIPYYLYVSAEDTQQRGFRDPTSRWRNQLTERFRDQHVAWEDVLCDSPVGVSIPWRRLRVEGEQAFYYVDKEGQGQELKMPGIFEVYYRVEGNWAVALAWRVPKTIAEYANVDKWAPMVAGAVDFGGRAGAPAR